MIRRAIAILRKTLLVGLTLLAVWTLVEWALDNIGDGWHFDPPRPLVYDTGVWRCGFSVRGGYLAFLGCKQDLPLDTPDATRPGTNRLRQLAGFGFISGAWIEYMHGGVTRYATARWEEHSAFCPAWFAFLIFAAYPAAVLIRNARRRHRRKRGLCFDCGHNLSGNTSAVCPE